ncbi:natterin-3-like [Acanthopagrus latus]|uniref:natterin-3-like n=1 Tax=Acanthopagrus latus TaxID=8177 RepID=UPI00187C40B0|nr:natterin-3-like [Acanthopagrus latus]
MDTGMMKLSVLLLLVLLPLSSATPLDLGDNTEQRDVSELTADGSVLADRPPLTVAKLRQRRQVQSSTPVSTDSSNLEWVIWNNSLPNDAVAIYNEYVGRTDYVCKFQCEAGFYNPSEGPYCHYAKSNKAYLGSPFEILVNKDNFEILEWNDGSYGSVPQNSVRTCPGVNIYVGQNKYGLGEVSTQDKCFYLPWKGSEYWYRDYQVLTINENIVSQKIYDVKYITDESKTFQYPPEIMRKTVINNNECSTVTKTDTLTQSYEAQQRWDINFSFSVGVSTTIEAGIPLIAEDDVTFSTEVAFQYSKGNTVTETNTDTVSVEITAPPNHSCTATMKRLKYKLNIPFTALFSRTYGNGEIHTMSITGMYDSVQTAEIQAEMDRCEVLNNSKPCT